MNPPLLTTTESIDFSLFYIIAISIVILVGVTAVMIGFAVRYHRSRHPAPTSQVSHNVPLELIWTLVPTFIALSMFWYGWSGYLSTRDVPEGSMAVTVTARMWSWLFEYENGRTSDRLYVPVGRPVRVNIRSADVIHSFYVPAFRIKRDAVPGMDTYVWFVAEEPGSYDVYCTEYCGTGHADMITTVEALPEEDFLAWLEAEVPAVARGRQLLQQYGCLGCHSLDGTPGVGPTLQGIFGREVTVVTDGRERTITADADYIRRSVLEPGADIVQGYPPVMPSYQGQIPDGDIEEIVSYLEKGEENGELVLPSGEALVRQKGCIGCHSTDGSKMAGPTFQGIFGREVTVVRDGKETTVQADEAYIERAIREPQAEVTKGYPPIMPAFPDLTEEEMRAIVEYLKGL